jgi:hypothetical protein
MTSAQKTFAALAVTLIVVLGGFSVGQAQGVPALQVLLAAELNHAMPGGTFQLHRTSPSLGSISETGGLAPTYKHQAPRQPFHLFATRASLNLRPPGFLKLPRHKVSLHVLQSVFLL